MEPNPVRWFEIYVKDMERAKDFYQKVFSVKLEKLESPEMEMWTFPMSMGASGAAGALVKMDGMSPGASGTLVYFGCEDCSVEERKAGENGGKVQKSKMSIGEYGFISLVLDTEENLIGLHSQK